MRLVAGAGVILIAWIVLFLLFAGVGLLPARLLGLRDLDEKTLHQSFWFGLGLTTLFLRLWNFIFPVTWHAQVLFGVAALSGLIAWRNGLRSLARRAASRPDIAGVVLLLGMWLANRATWFCCSFDTAMQDVPAIKWITTYPVVPGLGNLNERLALANSNYMYAALLDTGPLAGLGSHLANGLLMFVFLSTCVMAAFRVWRGGPEPMAGAERSGTEADDDTAMSMAIIRVVLIAPAMLFVLRPQLQSFNSNLDGVILAFVATLEVYRFLAKRSSVTAWSLVVTAGILATSVAFKINVAVFATIAVTAVGIHGYRVMVRDALPYRRRALTWATIFCVAMGLSWIARNIVLSGYPAFPSRALAAPVPWRTPPEQAQAFTDWVRHQGRVDIDLDYALSQGARWILPWVASLMPTVDRLINAQPDGSWAIGVPCILAILFGAAAFRARKRHGPRKPRSPGLILVPALFLGLCFWFVTAPQPRLGLAMAWPLAGLALAGLPPGSIRRHTARRGLLAGLLVLGISPLPLMSLRYLVVEHRGLRATAEEFWLRPPPASGLFHAMPRTRVRQYVTSSGLVLQVPRGHELRCRDAPLPCTPFPAPNIRLRRPPDLRWGFVTDGPWQAERWPYPWGNFKESWLRYQHRRVR